MKEIIEKEIAIWSGKETRANILDGQRRSITNMNRVKTSIFSGAKGEMGEIRGNMVSSSCILVPSGCIWRRGTTM